MAVSPSESQTGSKSCLYTAPPPSSPCRYCMCGFHEARTGKHLWAETVRVSLFITCFNDTLFPDTGRGRSAVLERLGCAVDFPEEQTCCGQMHRNSGHPDEAARAGGAVRPRVRGAEVVVTPSASCAAMVREQPPATCRSTSCRSSSCSSSGWRTSAPTTRTASPTTRPATRCGCCAWATRRCACCATCAGWSSSSCDMASECCGFGGTFAVKNADTSMAMLSDKLRHVLDTGAEVVCVAGHVVPDAHRRRAAPPADGGSDRPPGGDPRLDGMSSLRRPHRASSRAARRWRSATAQLRRNLANATTTIRAKRAGVVAELPDWEELRAAGAALKDATLARLDEHLEELEAAVTRAGGVVHWARDAAEANRIVVGLARSHGAEEVVKVKSIATDEIGLNEALAAAGIDALETDLAELIIQLDDDFPSHILVPAIHRNRAEIRELFERTIGQPELERRAGRDRRGGAAAPARAVPAARRSR